MPSNLLKHNYVARKEKNILHSFIDQDYIYHYTSASGLKGILESHKLWFTDIHYMNDAEEIRLGIVLHKNELKKDGVPAEYIEQYPLNENSFHAFVACFSLKKDALGLWNYYTKDVYNHGFNISFDYKKLVDSILNKNKFLNGCNITCGIVDYSHDGESEFVEKCHHNIKMLAFKKNDKMKTVPVVSFDEESNKFKIAGIEFLLFEKNSDFEEEKEFRIVIEIPKYKLDQVINNKKIYKFRVSNGIFIPYLEVEFDIKAIVGLTIAPTLKNDLALRSLEEFCRYNGLTLSTVGKGIESSKIPVRF